MTTWVDELAPGAPDIVAAWRGIEVGRTVEIRREVRTRGGEGTAERVAPQLAALAGALTAVVQRLSDDDLGRDGGEEDSNVARGWSSSASMT
jgi:hypothetical protein